MQVRISESLDLCDTKMANLSGKKILVVISPKDFQDKELLDSIKVLEASNASIVIASKKVKEAVGKFGTRVEVDYDIDEVIVQDYDAVVFIGGSGTSVYFDDETAHEIARDSYSQGKVTAAICIAPVILANSGILKGKKVTVFPSGADDLKKAGARYTAKDVEVDGRIVTADGPPAAKKFGEAIVNLLK
jgi:protease I